MEQARMSAVEAVWRIESDVAHLSCGPLSGVVHLNPKSHPHFLPTTWNGTPQHGMGVFLVDPPAVSSAVWEIRENYIRGSDLVCSYAPLQPDNLTPHIYWRASVVGDRRAARIELIVSLQTDLLESRPSTTVQTSVRDWDIYRVRELDVPAVEPIASPSPHEELTSVSAPGLFVVRNPAAGFTYAEMAQPTDHVSTEVDFSFSEQRWRMLRTQLLTDRLEKGVIRRARICGWFLPAENDLAMAVELAKQFIDEPLPLTT